MRFDITFPLTALALCVAGSASGQTLIVGGPGPGIATAQSTYDWQSAGVQAFRAELENPARFGPSGVEPYSIQTVDVTSFDASGLAGIDLLVLPYWASPNASVAEMDAAVQFFLGGGSVLVAQAATNTDPFSEALGLPIIGNGDGQPLNGTEAPFSGPFGTASNVLQVTGHGVLDPVAVAAHNGTPASVNSVGDVSTAVWNAGDYAPSAGRLVILTDSDMISTIPDFATPNDNATYLLNAVAFALCDGGEIAQYGVGCPGSGGIVPSLAASGCPAAGGMIEVTISGGLGGATGVLFAGIAPASTPTPGGCSLLVDVTQPFIVVPFLLTGAGPGNGVRVSPAPIDAATPPGLQLFMQAWISDPGAPSPALPFSATQGVSLTIAQ